MAADFGDAMQVEVWTDSSASKGICSRIGLGKVRHLDTGLLWIQNYVEKGIIKVKKVKGTENPADIGTKPVNKDTIQRVLTKCGFVTLEGMSARTLKIVV